MKRLLLISYCGPPNAAVPAKRVALFARHLFARGWRTTILSAHPRYAEVRDDFFLEYIPDACPSVYTRSFEPVVSRFTHGDMFWKPQQSVGLCSKNWFFLLFRGILSSLYPIREPQWGWIPFAWKAACQIIERERPEAAIISVPPFSALSLAVRLKRKYGVKVVLDYRDPWHQYLDGRVRPFFPPTPIPLRTKWQVHLELQALRSAEAVITASPKVTGQLRDRLYPCCRIPVVTVTNAFDPEILERVSAKVFDRFTIVHGGSMNGPRIEGLRLLRACGDLLERSCINAGQVRILLFPGTLPDRFNAGGLQDVLARHPALRQVMHLMPYETYPEYLSYVKGADLLFLASGAMKEIILAKFFDYLAARRPILALAEPDGAMSDIVKETGSGIVVPYNDQPRLISVLHRLVCRELDVPAPHERIVSRFSAATTVERLSLLLEAL